MHTKVEIFGIKCDKCDFKDESVEAKDFNLWLNKPCPKCSSNLLTEHDCAIVQQILDLNNLEIKDNLKVEFSVKFNGSNKIEVSEPTVCANSNNSKK